MPPQDLPCTPHVPHPQEFPLSQRVEGAIAELQAALAESFAQLEGGQRQALLGSFQRRLEWLGLHPLPGGPEEGRASASDGMGGRELMPEALIRAHGGHGSQISPPGPGSKALSRGQIVGETADFWVQQVAYKLYVGHQKRKFTKPLRVGAVIEIGYPDGESPVVTGLGVLCALTAEREGVIRANANSARPERSVAFECLARATAVVRCPELANAFTVLDAAESRSRFEFRANISAQRLVVRATRAAMIRTLNKGGLPAPEAISRALAQGVPG